MVELEQADRFGEIGIEWCGDPHPDVAGADRRRVRRLNRWATTSTCSATATHDSHDSAEYVRAIEAVVLVAHEPVPPELLAQLLERSITDIERWCHELAAGYEADGPRLPARARRRRVPLPDVTRPDPVRRALPAPRSASPSVGGGAGDAGHRRLQAADLAGPDRLDPRRRSRRRAAHAAGSGLHRRRRPRRRAGPGRAVRHDGGRSSRSSVWTPSTRLPPIADFIPGADVVEALEAGLRVTDGGPP